MRKFNDNLVKIFEDKEETDFLNQKRKNSVELLVPDPKLPNKSHPVKNNLNDEKNLIIKNEKKSQRIFSKSCN